jgi:aldose 1-epimerase
MKNEVTLSGLQPSQFQQVVNGKETRLCVLTNKAGTELTILNYGARIVSLMVPDRNKKMTDVVTGFGSIADYLGPEDRYFGAVCGRYANRIAKGRFTLDGVIYDQLAVNNGPNHLHGGLTGFDSVVWDMNQIDDHTAFLEYTSVDGEEGYPGTLYASVTYYLDEKNSVFILYKAETDKPTVVNLTNHSFFNLSGAGTPSIDNHSLFINADYYLPTDNTAIPYGKKAAVKGTPMDFRNRKLINDQINDNF